MNAIETAQVLAYLANAWPNTQVTEEQTQIWAGQLIGVDPEVGREAAQALVGSSEWFPTVAAFREAVNVVVRRRQMDRRTLPEGPSTDPRRFPGLLRQILAEGYLPCEALGQTLCPACEARMMREAEITASNPQGGL